MQVVIKLSLSMQFLTILIRFSSKDNKHRVIFKEKGDDGKERGKSNGERLQDYTKLHTQKTHLKTPHMAGIQKSCWQHAIACH